MVSTLGAAPAAGSAASARRSIVNCDAATPAPTPTPERRRKARRSIVGNAREAPRARLATRLDPAVAASTGGDLRLNSMANAPFDGRALRRQPAGVGSTGTS